MIPDTWGPTLAGLTALACLGLLASTRLASDLVLLSGCALLLVLGVVPAEVVLAGFASPAVATIAALFVVVAGIRFTGALDGLGPWLLGRRPRPGLAGLRLCGPVAAGSALLNNTPLVALLIPVVTDWCRSHGIASSRLLIPLSYAAILGGTCTLIGTTTNLVVNGLLTQSGHGSLGIFTPALIGIPITLAGLATLLLAGRFLLPDREPAIDPRADSREFTSEVLVPAGSPVAGRSIAAAGLRHLPDVYLVRHARPGHGVSLARPSDLLAEGDRLTFAGSREGVAKVAARKGLIPAEADDLRSATPSRVLVEAVVAPGSPLVGRSINQAAFRTHYNAAVVALARQGSGMSDSLGDHVLHAGDVLLLESAPAFLEQFRHSSDFFLVGGVDHAAAREHGRAPVALGLLLMMVLSVALGLVDLLPAALLAAAAMIVTRCCSPIQARRAIDERLLLTIAGAVGIGSALAATGVAASVAESVVALSAGSPWLALVALYVVAVIATELVTNTAAAVLLWPLALGIADDLSVSVLPFALALMVAASASFITPLGYQTNLMVAGPGGYRFTDFIRAGLPVSLVVGTVAVVLIPMLFPFA